MADMDRRTRLSLAHAIVERTRDYTNDAFNDLFRAMDDIERLRGLIPKLTEAEEAAVAAAEERLARGEHLPELELRGPIEDLLPEPHESILARLAALPEDEQDAVFDMIALLIDIDQPRLSLSPEQIAGLRRTLREQERGEAKYATEEEVEALFDRLREGRAES
jgi:predicted transcriptional regulator